MDKICSNCCKELNISNFSGRSSKCNKCVYQIQKEKKELYKIKQKDESNIKICKSCNIEYQLINFAFKKNECKFCINKKRQIKYKEEIKTKKIVVKVCKYCNEEKSIKNGNKCIDCINKRRTELRMDKNPLLKERKELLLENKKKCKDCNKIKDIILFRDKRYKCKECEKKDGKEYRQSIVGKQKAKDWSDNNKEHHHYLQSQWFQNNKKHIYKRIKERIKLYPELKFISNYRSRLRDAIKKEYKSEIYLRCSYLFLQNYLKEYFKLFNDFTIQNYGSVWHIDHVIPISRLDQKDKTNHWSLSWINLAPLSKEDNLKKNKYIWIHQVKQHNNFLNNYIKKFDKKQQIGLRHQKKEFEEYIATHLKMAGNSLLL